MEDSMLAAAGDEERVLVLKAARAFKQTWLALAEALTKVHERESWTRWGYDSFESYYRNELHIRKTTVAKLLGSYRFLKADAPQVIERSRRDVASNPLPSLQAVDFVARAAQRGAADDATMRDIQAAAFDEGAEAPALARRFKEVAFPVTDEQRNDRLRAQLKTTARRLANLIAEPDLPVPHPVAVALEESLGLLFESLEAGNPAPPNRQ